MRFRVSALLLAAGSGRRMGRTKQLLPLCDRPAVEHAARSILMGGVDDVVVVTGTGHEAVRASLTHLPVRFALNDDPESDMAGSIRVGLKEIAISSSGVLVCLADHPLVSHETITGIIREHAKGPGRIIIPAHNGKKGHPTLFPAPLIRGIASTGSLRDIIAGNPGLVFFVDVPDEGVLLDMDTEEDYRRLLERFRK
ncbi:MAG: nucleotidyltransferase family protein [Nitrospirae bacterium]|nr:nucleotidyltransferase family protein [Nitrospirota bacterium]